MTIQPEFAFETTGENEVRLFAYVLMFEKFPESFEPRLNF